jgi:ABC-2 type transport system permease protein
MGRNGVLRQLVVLTARQVLGRRRVILALLAGCAPILVAVTNRLAGGLDDAAWLPGLVDGLVITTLLPLVALIFGTSVLGGEIDDGTIVFLLVRPIPRWQIVLAKLGVAAVAVTALVGTSAVIATLVSSTDATGPAMAFAALAGVAWGALAYTAIAVALSLVTSHSLMVGLVYVYIWEGVVAGLFTGTRLLSVHQYVLGVAAALDPHHPSVLPWHLEPATSVGLGALVVVGATAIAIRRLSRFQVSERG